MRALCPLEPCVPNVAANPRYVTNTLCPLEPCVPNVGLPRYETNDLRPLELLEPCVPYIMLCKREGQGEKVRRSSGLGGNPHGWGVMIPRVGG